MVRTCFVKSIYHRKSQKKNITLHRNSHHPESTKIETIPNFYRTAEHMSTGTQEEEQSRVIIDNLLDKMGTLIHVIIYTLDLHAIKMSKPKIRSL